MYCLKCGRDVYGDQVFCSDCLSVMDQYPVKPGTAIQLPKRREGNAAPRPVSRRKNLTAEDQIRKLRRSVRNLFVLWLVTFLALCAMSVPGIAHILEQDHFGLGQNYSVISPNDTNNE